MSDFKEIDQEILVFLGRNQASPQPKWPTKDETILRMAGYYLGIECNWGEDNLLISNRLQHLKKQGLVEYLGRDAGWSLAKEKPASPEKTEGHPWRPRALPNQQTLNEHEMEIFRYGWQECEKAHAVDALDYYLRVEKLFADFAKQSGFDDATISEMIKRLGEHELYCLLKFPMAQVVMQVHGWQPIETAPIEKTILVLDAKGGVITYRIDHKRRFVYPVPGSHYWDWKPTHWAPIPTVPSGVWSKA